MPNLFVTEEDVIVVKFAIAETTDERGFVVGENFEAIENQFGNVLKGNGHEDYSVTFRRPSFGDSVKISDDIYSISDDHGLEFNPQSFRYARMGALLKSWDLKDMQGNDVPATKENMEKLDLTIADTILVQLESVLNLL
jgi:hypothetical protein